MAMMPESFDSLRSAALALLQTVDPLLAPNQARFCGEMTVWHGEPSEKQLNWIVGLLRKADLPPLAL